MKARAAKALRVGRRLWPVARVLWKERKAEVAVVLAVSSLVREVIQALGH